MTSGTSKRPPAGREARLHERVRARMHAHPALAVVWKTAVAVVGSAVLAVGVVMIVTPGPAIVLIPLGLAILATEFRWARQALEIARERAVRARRKAAAREPRVRRRNRLVALAVLVVVLAAVAAYVAVFDWPTVVVHGWDRLQSLAGWLPDLPGM
ncbi:MAG: TIGR02611 family protein [Nocardioidaceae bacterium]